MGGRRKGRQRHRKLSAELGQFNDAWRFISEGMTLRS
jgi:hypothetical protein